MNLYVNDNCISKISGLENLVNLGQLNLADNFVGEITGLQNCKKLRVLTLSNNSIGRQKDCRNVDAIKGVLECPSLETLDIRKNFLDDPIVIDEVIVKMKNLAVFYAKENEFVRHVTQYKKQMIVKCPGLGYLEDAPIFPADRRIADAYHRGTDRASAQKEIEEERARIRAEATKKRNEGAARFKDMVSKARKDKQEFERIKENELKGKESMSL